MYRPAAEAAATTTRRTIEKTKARLRRELGFIGLSRQRILNFRCGEIRSPSLSVRSTDGQVSRFPELARGKRRLSVGRQDPRGPARGRFLRTVAGIVQGRPSSVASAKAAGRFGTAS